jgi:L-serine dehydratase
VEVELFGSLSATGRGHGTPQAILAGLLGNEPATAPPDLLPRLQAKPERRHPLSLAGLEAGLSDILFGPVDHDLGHPNAMRFRLLDNDGEVLLERTFFSPGGGFISWAGKREPRRGAPTHPFRTMTGLRKRAAESGLTIPEIMIRNESALGGAAREDILSGLHAILRTMESSVERGVRARGLLPGPLGVSRKGGLLLENAARLPTRTEQALCRLDAYAHAAAEENAAGATIVTAPTAGSCGVLAGLVRFMRRDLRISRTSTVDGLLAAGAVGLLARSGASISGAEVGCQGEIGVASAMAAACLAQARGLDIAHVEASAEIALEHHLGMTCDPVGGYVQIPCIERNSMGAVRAWNAYVLAAAGDPTRQKVGLDAAIRTMAETGRDMCPTYKETSLAGLARRRLR